MIPSRARLGYLEEKMIPVFITKLNYKIVGGLSVVLVGIGVVFGFVMMPKMIVGQVVKVRNFNKKWINKN